MTSAAGAVHAIVPVKAFDRAKSRLLPVLGRAGCAELAEAMLIDVLDVLLSAEGLSDTLVITADDAATALARSRGASVLHDPCEAGTDTAVRLGLRHAIGHGARAALIVHADLPFLSGLEIERVLGSLRVSPLVLVPAHGDGGTNLMAMSPPGVVETAFGADSFVRHLSIAEVAGVKPFVLHLEGAGHDIDQASDLRQFPKGGSLTRFVLRRLLHQLAA